MNFDEDKATPLDSGEACAVIAGICVALLAFVGIASAAVRFWQ